MEWETLCIVWFLLLGFLPVGLAYHALITLVASGLWAWAAFYGMREGFDFEGTEPESS